MKAKATRSFNQAGHWIIAGRAYEVHQFLICDFQFYIQLEDFKDKDGSYLNLKSVDFQALNGGPITYVRAYHGEAHRVFGNKALYIHQLVKTETGEELECRVMGNKNPPTPEEMKSYPISNFDHTKLS